MILERTAAAERSPPHAIGRAPGTGTSSPGSEHRAPRSAPQRGFFPSHTHTHGRETTSRCGLATARMFPPRERRVGPHHRTDITPSRPRDLSSCKRSQNASETSTMDLRGVTRSTEVKGAHILLECLRKRVRELIYPKAAFSTNEMTSYKKGIKQMIRKWRTLHLYELSIKSRVIRI